MNFTDFTNQLLEMNGKWLLFLFRHFGFFPYATYDLINLATARDWPMLVTVVDLVWGTDLCGAVVWGSDLISIKIVQLTLLA